MHGLLPTYHVSAATWFYLSLPLIVALFFRFGRLWSLRNFDLALLLSMSPGLLLVDRGPHVGYAWLFAVTGMLLVRLFVDSSLTRRPRVEENLNVAGQVFLLAAVLVFLITKVVTEPPPSASVDTVLQAESLLQRPDAGTERDARPVVPAAVPVAEAATTAAGPAVQTTAPNRTGAAPGPATSLLATPLVPLSNAVAGGSGETRAEADTMPLVAARLLAVLSHLAVVSGLILVGYLHFRDVRLGLSMALLYVLVPCTAYDVHQFHYVLPAALVVWAIVASRRPAVAGGLIALASGILFFPIFLVPLWAAYYRRRGLLRFGLSAALVGVAIGLAALQEPGAPTTLREFTWNAIDWSLFDFQGTSAAGFWTAESSAYRIPVFAAFCVMTVVLSVWPLRKSLDHLMAGSTAIVVGTQFWYPREGGVYLQWYLPLMLLVMFRPRVGQFAASEPIEPHAHRRDEPHAPRRTHVTITPSVPPRQMP